MTFEESRRNAVLLPVFVFFFFLAPSSFRGFFSSKLGSTMETALLLVSYRSCSAHLPVIASCVSTNRPATHNTPAHLLGPVGLPSEVLERGSIQHQQQRQQQQQRRRRRRPGGNTAERGEAPDEEDFGQPSSADVFGGEVVHFRPLRNEELQKYSLVSSFAGCCFVRVLLCFPYTSTARGRLGRHCMMPVKTWTMRPSRSGRLCVLLYPKGGIARSKQQRPRGHQSAPSGSMVHERTARLGQTKGVASRKHAHRRPLR